jgi:hypothetical protein
MNETDIVSLGLIAVQQPSRWFLGLFGFPQPLKTPRILARGSSS